MFNWQRIYLARYVFGKECIWQSIYSARDVIDKYQYIQQIKIQNKLLLYTRYPIVSRAWSSGCRPLGRVRARLVILHTKIINERVVVKNYIITRGVN